MENCIFCQIIDGKIPSRKVYEDDTVLAFYDNMQQSPVHVLIVPKTHIESLLEVGDNSPLMGHLLFTVQKLARELGVAESGFRLVCNTGSDGGQSVNHLHFHLMGGRGFGWPPG